MGVDVPPARPNTASSVGMTVHTPRELAKDIVASNKNSKSSNTLVGASSSQDDTNVRVAVRVRPLVAKERMEKARECIRIENKSVVIGKDRRFTFDFAYGPNSLQEEVYQDCVASLVEGCFSGYNATVLAYGQTGSGKTYTMGSGNTSSLLEEQVGVIPRVILNMFDRIEEQTHNVDFLVRCSFLEIYNEEVRDLLHLETVSKNIHIRERENGEIFVAGAKEEVATSYDDLARLLDRGSTARTTGSTLMNQQSSRSHAIFTIVLEQHRQAGEGGKVGGVVCPPEYTTAKFHLVDLAGSERNKKTQAHGGRMREGININCGLLALGNVISALGDETKRGGHVPYRESKLTRLLQDSLGGNSRTVMIACCSGADANMEESLNCLKYANRARNIRNKPIVNNDQDSTMLATMQAEIAGLKMKLLNQQLGSGDPEGILAGPSDVMGGTANRRMIEELYAQLVGERGMREDTELVAVLRRQHEEAEGEVIRLQGELSRTASQVAALKDETFTLRAERDLYLHQLEESQRHMTELGEAVELLKADGHVDGDAYPCLVGLVAASPANQNRRTSPPGGRDSTTLPPRPGGPVGGSALSSDPPSGARPTTSCGPRRPSQPGPEDLERDMILRPSTAGGGGGEGAGGSGTIREDTRSALEQHMHTIKKLQGQLAHTEGRLVARESTLAEAQEDLARDELIFAAKVKEIKALKRELVEREREREATQEAHQEMVSKLKADHQAELQQLQAAVAPAGPAAGGGAVTATVRERFPGSDDEDEDEEEDEEEERNRLRQQELERELQAQTQKLVEREEEQTREFRVERQETESQLRELQRNILLKSQLIEELGRNEAEARALNHEYHRRMTELESAVAGKEAEMDLMRHELVNLETDKLKSDDEKRKMRDAFEEKLRKMQMQVSALKKQQEQHETTRLEKVRMKSELKVQALEGELGRMRQHSDQLKKKLKDNEHNYEEQCRVLAKEKAKMAREADTRDRRIRELEAENKRQKAALRKKESQAITHARITDREKASGGGGTAAIGTRKDPHKDHNNKESSATTKDASAASGKGRGGQGTGEEKDGNESTPGGVERRKSRVRRSAEDTGIPLPPPTSGGDTVEDEGEEGGGMDAEACEVEEWLGAEVQAVLRREELASTLQAKRAKLQALAQDREQLVEKRANIELRQARASASLSGDLGSLKQQEERLQEALNHTPRDHPSLPQLQDDLKKLQHHQRVLHERLQAGSFGLTPEAEENLREVDERLDAIEAEEEYVSGEVAELEGELKSAESRLAAGHGRLRQRLRGTPAQVLFSAFASRLAQAHAKEDQEQHRVVQLEEQLQAQRRACEELRHAAQRREMSLDAERTRGEREHARKVQLLLQQINTLQEASLVQEGQKGGQGQGQEEVEDEARRGEGGLAGGHPEDRSGIMSLRQRAPPAPRPQPGAVGTSALPNQERNSTDLRSMLMVKEQQIEALDKDNFYYKQANRELKRRMRDLLTTTTDDPHSPGSVSARESELIRSNKQLQEEVQNCRAFMARTGASVRVSRKGVRELGGGGGSAPPTPPRSHTPMTVPEQRQSTAPVMPERTSDVSGSVNMGSVTMGHSEWRDSTKAPTVMSSMSLYDSLDGTQR